MYAPALEEGCGLLGDELRTAVCADFLRGSEGSEVVQNGFGEALRARERGHEVRPPAETVDDYEISDASHCEEICCNGLKWSGRNTGRRGW